MLMKVIITQSWRGLCQLDCHNYGGNMQALIKITTSRPKGLPGIARSSQRSLLNIIKF